MVISISFGFVVFPFFLFSSNIDWKKLKKTNRRDSETLQKPLISGDIEKPSPLALASADKSGYIFIWNVLEATVFCSLQGNFWWQVFEKMPFQKNDLSFFSNHFPLPFTENGKAVLEMRWHPNDSQILLSLHSTSTLILWNVSEGTKVFNDQQSLIATLLTFRAENCFWISKQKRNGNWILRRKWIRSCLTHSTAHILFSQTHLAFISSEN